MKHTTLCILGVYLMYTFSIQPMYTFCSSNLEHQKVYKKYTCIHHQTAYTKSIHFWPRKNIPPIVYFLYTSIVGYTICIHYGCSYVNYPHCYWILDIFFCIHPEINTQQPYVMGTETMCRESILTHTESNTWYSMAIEIYLHS